MDVKVSSFAQKGTRVLDPECTLCQACIAACPNRNLRLTLGLDVAAWEAHPQRMRVLRIAGRTGTA